MREGVQASLLGGGGAACEPLMWGLEHLGVVIPNWVALSVVVVSATLLLLAVITLAHMSAVWLRARGRGKLGQMLIIAVGTAFVLIGVGAITYGFVWFQPKVAAIAQADPPAQASAPEAPDAITNNSGIITKNQSGGQNTIANQAPPPDLKMIGPTKTTPNNDGTFTISQLAEVVARYPPGNLTLNARAEGVLGITANPQRPGIFMMGLTGESPGLAFTNLVSPFGKYIIDATAEANRRIWAACDRRVIGRTGRSGPSESRSLFERRSSQASRSNRKLSVNCSRGRAHTL